MLFSYEPNKGLTFLARFEDTQSRQQHGPKFSLVIMICLFFQELCNHSLGFSFVSYENNFWSVGGLWMLGLVASGLPGIAVGSL